MCCIPEPNVIERECGGYLAISPRFAQFRIGVTAPTEPAARDKFKISYAEWINLFPETTN